MNNLIHLADHQHDRYDELRDNPVLDETTAESIWLDWYEDRYYEITGTFPLRELPALSGEDNE